MQKPKPIASHHVHSGRIIQVSTERLLYNNGREYDLDFVRHPGAAAVVAVDATGRVCFVRQYRHGVEDFLWEIPAGKLDPGEAPQACAVRELAEETGVQARRWTSLGQFLPAPGADEELEIQWLPIEEAAGMVLRGEWSDGKTGLALWRAQYHLQM